MNQSLSDRLWDMKFGLQRSYYYYESRRCFWVLFLIATKGLEFLIGYPAIVQLIQGHTKWFLWVRSAVALCSFVLTLCKATNRIKTLGVQMRGMKECLDMLPYRQKDEKEKLYRRIKSKREEFEKDDDVIFEVVDAMCHNKACKTLNVSDRYQISFLQRILGWWLPLPYTTKARLINPA